MGKEKPTTKICKHCQSEIPYKAKVCPQCRKKQGPGGCLTVILVVILIALIGSCLGSGKDDDSKNETTKVQAEQGKSEKANDAQPEETTTEAEPEITYTAYTVTQMMDDLKSNAMKAESTYKDQYVEITGRLDVIDSKGKYISLYPEDNEWAFVGVQCYIKSEEQKQKVMEMSTDDIVTLRGKVKSVGEVLGYSLDIDEIIQ